MSEKSLVSLKLKIADIVLEMIPADSEINFDIDESQKIFATSEGKPEMTLKIYYGNIPEYVVSEENKVFESGGIWSLYKKDGDYIMPFQSPVLDKNPYKLAVLDSHFKSGDVYIQAIQSTDISSQSFRPLEYPLDEILMVNLLSLGRGIEIHACGIIDSQGKGIIFSGTSGAGKSTLANLWRTKEKITILSDDRVIVRRKRDRFQLYGTPWHGEARICSSKSVPLEKIFFLKQTPENYIREITNIDAVSRLLVRCFPTFYNFEGMEYTLKLCAEISKEIPCYELGFVPNKSVLDLIENSFKNSI